MPRRILIYGNLTASGGISTHVGLLAPLLSEYGNEVTVASLSSDLFDIQGERFRRAGLRTISTGLPSSAPARARRLRALVEWPRQLGRGSFDVVCGFGGGGFFTFMRAFVARGGLLVYGESSAGIPDNNRMLNWHALMLRAVDAVLCISPSAAAALRRNRLRAPIRVLPHMTGIRAPENLPDRQPPGDSGELRAAYFGRLTPDKNTEMLLELWPALRLGPSRLSFYGGGPLLERLRQLVREKGIGDVVTVHGPYDREADLANLMARTALIVLPSQSEGLGLVLLEGMAYGVPFVAGNVGGSADLAQYPYGIAVPPDPASLAAAVEAMAHRIRRGLMPAGEIQDAYRRAFSHEVLAPAWIRALNDTHSYFGLTASRVAAPSAASDVI